MAILIISQGGGWVVKIENKDHLSPAEAVIGAELGNTSNRKLPCFLHKGNENAQVDVDLRNLSIFKV